MNNHPYLNELKKKGMKLGLERMYEALNQIQNPHKYLKGSLIAGTNGKGSTAFILYKLLLSIGFKTALYTSPHIREINDRYLISDIKISDEDLLHYIDSLKEISERNNLTLFEFETLIAFKYFYDQKVDFAIFEVGMGGRLDATNCFEPSIKVITSISKDHIEYLGDTEEKILFEKAGIIKHNNTIISGINQTDLIEQLESICKEHNSRLIQLNRDICINDIREEEGYEYFNYRYLNTNFDNICLSLFGRYQISNCALAITSFLEIAKEYNIQIDKEILYNTLKNIHFGGRFEIYSKNPLIIIDGAHNIDGITRLKESIVSFNKENKKILCIFSTLNNKDPERKIEILKDIVDQFIFVENHHPLSVKRDEFIHIAKKLNISRFDTMDLKSAIMKSQEDFNNYLILITGSLYTLEPTYNFLENIYGRERK